MKRKIIHALALALGLLCALTACAETLEEVRAELGNCSIDDYADSVYTRFEWEEPEPFQVTDRSVPGAGMTVWDILWEYPGTEWYDTFCGRWFPSRGLVADAWFDLDADGKQEWIALVARPSEEPEEDPGRYADLWLCVYEVSGEEARLAAEQIISEGWDCTSNFTRVSLSRLNDGTPVVIAQDSFGVDGYYMLLWEFSYDGGALAIRGGLANYPWEVGGAMILLGSGTSLQAVDRCRQGIWADEVEPDAILPRGSDPEAPVSANILDFLEYSDEEFRSTFLHHVSALEVSVGYDGEWRDDRYVYEAVHNSERELMLLRASSFERSDDGRRIFRIERRLSENSAFAVATGDCNLRAEPNLNAPGLGVIPKGARAKHLGEESVDERGVAWYRVRYEGLEGWASSKYLRLCESERSGG